ncbi:MAG: YggS family pyridoxal phosphate-dependent enzyme [Rhodobacteraceae bacterium]|nr:YggS family pyridoxal phosphate-dependent enzyme [Paracoccaceae bacterium]
MSLDDVVSAIRHAERRFERIQGAVDLVAVSKVQPLKRVEAALVAGHRRFGENRVQEAQEKWPLLKQSYEGILLHLIGPLQTNKVKQAVELFDVIETVDREKLARKLADEIAKLSKAPELYIQVNTGEEPQKAGIFPKQADAFIDLCRCDLALPVIGLMCIPPAGEPPSPHFALLRNIAEHNGLSKLSMGMSSDFEEAISLGATSVRVGSAVFGERVAEGP